MYLLRATVQIFGVYGINSKWSIEKPLNSNALSEQGINSTYNITVGGIENLDISDHTQDEKQAQTMTLLLKKLSLQVMMILII